MKKKKVKKYAEGGLAGLAETAESLMGDVDNMANTVNYGTTTPTMGGSGESVGFGAVAGFRKGGMVKKKCDGIAKRGKTKGRMV